MTTLRTRLQRLERDGSPSMPDFSAMTDEELEKLGVDLTRESLRSNLNREPTEAEVTQQRDKEKAFFASLNLEELLEFKAKLARQARTA